MSTHSPRRPLKGCLRDSCQRKMVLNVDLNEIPPLEDRDLEVISNGIESQEAQTSVQGGGLLPPVTIDVDAIEDDEVLISSPRSFAEARNNSRRYNSGLSLNGCNKRRRVSPGQTTINSELCINLESKDVKNNLKPPEPPVPLPREEEPKFNCPVCLGQLDEETSTKCGHIFCKKCIRTAISAQNKCPTCRRRLTMRDIIRIYLPSSN